MAEEIGKKYTIGELAKKADVNLQTIRYYERRKLLMPVARKESGYRLYDRNVFRRLMFIRHAKELGFTLEEIKELLDLRLGSAESPDACKRVKARAEDKLKAVEDRIAAMESVRKILIELVGFCERRTPTEECPILKAIDKEIKR